MSAADLTPSRKQVPSVAPDISEQVGVNVGAAHHRLNEMLSAIS